MFSQNNRHTSQSWRDRWVKYVSFRPRPPLPEEDPEDNVGDGPATSGNIQLRPQSRKTPTQPDPQPAPRPTKLPSRTQASSSATRVVERNGLRPKKTPSASSKGSSAVGKSTGGTNFTEEETHELLNAYDDILNLDEDQIIDAWIAFAAEVSRSCIRFRPCSPGDNSLQNPTHTAQQWRNYFKKIKAEKGEKEDSNKVVVPQQSRQSSEITAKPSSSKESPIQTPEIKDSQGSSGQTIISPRAEKKTVDPSTVDERLFKSDLTALAEALELEVDFKPIICGRAIPLFRLWQVVQSNEFGGFDEVNGRKLWPLVARRLNFNDFQHFDAAADLHACYDEILADFEQAREEYKEINPDMALTESQEMALIESQLRQTASHETQNLSDQDEELVNGEYEDHDDDLDHPQVSPASLPPSSSSKRSFGSDRTYDTPFNKRQRIDKGEGKELEIPSTPEHVIDTNQMRRSSHKPSPLGKAPLEPEAVDSEDDELFVMPFNFSRPKPKPLPRNLEPETQDFHFPPPDPEPEQDDLSSSSSSELEPLEFALGGSIVSNTSAARNAIQSSQQDSSTQSQTSSQQERELDEYIERHIGLGYPTEIVIQAIEATTMEPANASIVMESLLNSNGIPENMEGVWTAEDDEALGSDAPMNDYRRILDKHGEARCDQRKKFLKDSMEVRASYDDD